MFKLNKSSKKGIGMVEVVCAMALFFILASFAYSVRCNAIKMDDSNRKLSEYVEFLNSLREYIYFNCTYSDVKNFKDQNLAIINKENISVNKIKENGTTMLVSTQNGERPYLIMNMEENENVIKITLNLYIKINNEDKSLKTVCFKGEY